MSETLPPTSGYGMDDEDLLRRAIGVSVFGRYYFSPWEENSLKCGLLVHRLCVLLSANHPGL